MDAAAVLRTQLESQKIAAATGAGQPTNQAAQLNAYNTLLNSQRTSQAGKAQIAMNLGIIYYNSKQYPQAVTYFTQAQQLGSTEPNLAANLAKAKFAAGDAQGGLTGITTLIDQQVQQKGKADEELYRFALSKTIQAKDAAGTLSWMRKYLAAYPTPKNWRDMIKIYGLQQGSFLTLSKNQSLDLYRLMRATGALADEYDYLAYADAANSVGLPWEAKTVITDGRAKGKVPATGTSTQLLSLVNTRIAAEGSLAALEAKSKTAADGKLASQTADAQLGSGNYPKAAELYRLALQKGGVDAAAINTRLGIALAMGGDKASAKTAFTAVSGSPSADVAALWSTYLDLSA
jgi:Flp pilus assembly protein TadD